MTKPRAFGTLVVAALCVSASVVPQANTMHNKREPNDAVTLARQASTYCEMESKEQFFCLVSFPLFGSFLVHRVLFRSVKVERALLSPPNLQTGNKETQGEIGGLAVLSSMSIRYYYDNGYCCRDYYNNNYYYN